MSDTPLNRLERLLDRSARAVSGGGLHPLEVLDRVTRAIDDGARDGVAPNEIVVQFNPADFARIAEGQEELEGALREAALETERQRGYRRIGDLTVRVEDSPRAARGSPTIVARFVDSSTRSGSLQGPLNPTRRVMRHRGIAVVTSTGDRVPLLHTPFSIGRGPGNDLVIPSFAVSRNHAEIVKVADGFAIKDAGSSNGVVVGGQRVSHAVLAPGVPVVLGDVTLWLEATA